MFELYFGITSNFFSYRLSFMATPKTPETRVILFFPISKSWISIAYVCKDSSISVSITSSFISSNDDCSMLLLDPCLEIVELYDFYLGLDSTFLVPSLIRLSESSMSTPSSSFLKTIFSSISALNFLFLCIKVNGEYFLSRMLSVLSSLVGKTTYSTVLFL